jgi:hypothetical protein
LLDLVAFAPIGTTIPLERASVCPGPAGTTTVSVATAALRIGAAKVRWRVDIRS